RGERVTAHASAHPRQLIARRELDALHSTVTGSAANLARRVHRVVELEPRRREQQPFDAIALLRTVAEVTIAALGAELAGVGAHVGEVLVVAAVTAVAARRRWQQRIAAHPARRRALVACGAGHFQVADVLFMIEAQRQALRRKYHTTRS